MPKGAAGLSAFWPRENGSADSQADYEASFSAYIVQPVSVGPENREMFTALRN